MMELLFVALSLLFYLKKYLSQNYKVILFNTSISGLMFCLAMLTTPRSFFLYALFVVPLFKILITGIKTRKTQLVISSLIHPFLSFGIPYLIWYYPHLGNIFEIIRYIAPAAQTQLSFTNNHIDLNPFIWLLVTITFFINAYFKKIKIPGYLYGFLFGCIFFISLVIPWSYHRGVIVPLLIFISIQILYLQKMHAPNISRYFFIAVFFIQVFVTGLKYGLCWSDVKGRDGISLQKIIQQHIPPESKVAGSCNYYYACKFNECDFRIIENNIEITTGKPVPSNKKINYLINIFRTDYLIVSNGEKELLNLLIDTGKFAQIATITIPEHPTFWQRNRTNFGLPGSSFYNGVIYKRNMP